MLQTFINSADPDKMPVLIYSRTSVAGTLFTTAVSNSFLSPVVKIPKLSCRVGIIYGDFCFFFFFFFLLKMVYFVYSLESPR